MNFLELNNVYLLLQSIRIINQFYCKYIYEYMKVLSNCFIFILIKSKSIEQIIYMLHL